MNRRELLSLGFLRKNLNRDSQEGATVPVPSLSDKVLARPPGAALESDFLKKCKGCPDCVENCPADAIKIEDGYAFLDLKEIPCSACEDLPCIDACSQGALSKEEKLRPISKVSINAKHCLHTKGVLCHACSPQCPPHIDAIEWTGSYGQKLPHLNQEKCIGCGLCWHACDQDSAIWMHEISS